VWAQTFADVLDATPLIMARIDTSGISYQLAAAIRSIRSGDAAITIG
jgi:hypothetical protein